MKSKKKSNAKKRARVTRLYLASNIKKARTQHVELVDATPEVMAVREQQKQWAIILCDKRRKKEHRAAANSIYKAFYNPLIYYFMRKIGVGAEMSDLQDLTMTTLEKVFSKIDKYDPNSAALSTWVYRIALNTLIDNKRSAKSIDVVSVEAINAHNVRTMGEADAELFELSSTGRDPLEDTDRNQTHGLVRQAIAALKNNTERRVIELRFLDEYSYEEIAETLKLPMGTVKALIFRAKDRLKESLSGQLEMVEA